MSATEIAVESETKSNVIGVDELQNYGINASDLQKLKASGIYTVNVWTSIYVGIFEDAVFFFLLLTLQDFSDRIICYQKEFGQD
mgnify:CR=1 FL=1